ncbi:MAG: hypothetical protein LBL18_00445 [Bacteroidales bacterium]|jgi:hypothetical protein|nr:hypothetical protein [Bacteroidales bacterium]
MRTNENKNVMKSGEYFRIKGVGATFVAEDAVFFTSAGRSLCVGCAAYGDTPLCILMPDCDDERLIFKKLTDREAARPVKRGIQINQL